MRLSIRAVAALAIVLVASFSLAADEAKKAGATSAAGDDAKSGAAATAAERPGRAANRAGARQARLTKPWSDLNSLSEDQKRQIREIHGKAVAEIRTIEQREKDEIMALLNDQQKAELKAAQEKDAADRKARAANRGARAGERPASKNDANDKDGADAAEAGASTARDAK